MVKRTLIAIAVVALLATSVNAAIQDFYFTGKTSSAVKVDGSDKPTINWPYQIVYEALPICNIPITMKVGMFVQVKDCKNAKIVLEQVPCADIGKTGVDDYPCYRGCADIEVRSNFDVKLGASLHTNGDVVASKNWKALYEGGDVITGDGDYHPAKLCVEAWAATIYKAAPGDAVEIGSVDVTVKPN